MLTDNKFLFYHSDLLRIDALTIIITTLALFAGICIGSFASRYMKGDQNYRAFFIRLGLLIPSVIIMVSADHLALLFVAWCSSNALLIRLMMHKMRWRAARASGLLAARTLAGGAICMAAAFMLFYITTGQTSIQAIITDNRLLAPASTSHLPFVALLLLLISAMTQSKKNLPLGSQ